MSFSLSNLTLAWRKAKVDLYYSTNPPLLEMADYEENLIANLEQLQSQLCGDDKNWVTEPGFTGDWTLMPKAVRFAEPAKEKAKEEESEEEESGNDTTLIFAAPEQEWQSQVSAHKKPVAEFRLMARCTMDFHVLSALWMLEVGHLFDEKLSDNVYGSRLRRTNKGAINSMALGSFKPYLKPFRDWRDGAINAMRTALADKKKVIALTADVTSFYHELTPDFMLDPDFLKLAGVTLSDEQDKLHRLFISALQAWAENTPLKQGLPVGLPASAVVANAALLRLDQFIQEQVVPLYYGRYVDDILLVMENTSNIKTSKQFWEWILGRGGDSNPLQQEKSRILFKPDYLKNDTIAFENNKNKLFILAGSPGTALINAISAQINQRASEWRALPNLPDNPGTIATDLLKATNHTGEQADNLRKTDALTLHRASFALNLRDYEAYERDLPPDAWQAHRHAFLDAVIEHVLTPKAFFELAQYLPRIVRMATACGDFSKLGAILKQLKKLTEIVTDQCDHVIKAGKNAQGKSAGVEIYRWLETLAASLIDNIISAWPARLSTREKAEWSQYMAPHWLWLSDELAVSGNHYSLLPETLPEALPELQRWQARLFSHDLAHLPLRFCAMPKEMVCQRGIPPRSKLVMAGWKSLDHAGLNGGVHTLASWIRPRLKGTPAGFYFATRPFSLNELYLINPDPFSPASHGDLCKVVLALRGFELCPHKMPQWDKHKHTLQIPDGEPRAKQTIAVSSWEMTEQQFVAAAMGQPEPDSRRSYRRLNQLINELISRPGGAGYLVLPELALPARWFMRIADKLKGRGISLISGVEYLRASKKRLHNQIWASLTHDGLGFPSLMLYRQDKQLPAFHEEQELFRLAGATMKPAVSRPSPAVIQHGDFHFAMLICSELTNIRYRADLRGKVDALFVPEWNPDTDTFNALVESAALDIHAYIIQCNNRQYGDSRIRAPYKNRWQRDLLRVKGGTHDYCITGEIDVQALRQFQSSHRSSARVFKPVPDGFNQNMAHQRKVLPKGE